MSQVISRLNGYNTGSDANKLQAEDRAMHDWYRFVLSFPPHLVREYLERFDITSNHCVLDPFCGTGTVPLECQKLGIPAVGFDAHPMAYFASKVKVDWHVDPDQLIEHAHTIAALATKHLRADGIEDNPLFSDAHYSHALLRTLSEEETDLLLTNSISPLPLHKTLVLLDHLHQHQNELYHHYELLALAKALVATIGNLHFGPEVGIGTIKTDAPVISTWLQCIQTIAHDLRAATVPPKAPARIFLGDTRQALDFIEPYSIDAVITSPPYPNEKDYTRTTRLESVILGFIANKTDLQTLKKGLVCSNTRTVYKDDSDDAWVSNNAAIQHIASIIEARRIELGKTSGFEKLYGRVTRLYFGGMTRHLAFLRDLLRPGAQLAYVVGDQASYFRIKIPTGKLLADIAISLGYQLVSIDLFRTRFSTVTKEQLREEVVVLRWPASFIHFVPNMPTPNIQQEKLGEMNLFSEDKQGNQELSANITASAPKINRYQKLMEHIFFSRYKEDSTSIEFAREELVTSAQELGIDLPKNLGDVVYSFRYRTLLPQSIRDKAPEGMQWIIRPSGRARYCFVATNVFYIVPNSLLTETKIPDATPGIVSMYALGDEQALLSKLRYNRLIDVFTGITCYSLQNHLRTTIGGIGQVETDEIYVGVDHRGAQYVIPLQAKGGNDKIGIVQIEQDVALCAEKFSALICKPLAAQFIGENRIALFEFEQSEEGIKLYREQHYRLVSPEEMTDADLQMYRQRSLEG